MISVVKKTSTVKEIPQIKEEFKMKSISLPICLLLVLAFVNEAYTGKIDGKDLSQLDAGRMEGQADRELGPMSRQGLYEYNRM